MMQVTSSQQTIQQYITQFDLRSFLNNDLLANLQLFEFKIYDHVYVEQTVQQYLYFLVEGQVQCSHYHLNGKLAVIALSNPFAAIGDVEILNEDRLRSNVIATQNSIMLGIKRDIVRRYGANDPRFLQFLIEQLKEKLYHTNALQMNQVLPLISRLSLYMLSQLSTESEALILPAKEELASLMGTTTRHLNRVLRQLVDAGHISDGYPRLCILDRDALEKLVQ